MVGRLRVCFTSSLAIWKIWMCSWYSGLHSSQMISLSGLVAPVNDKNGDKQHNIDIQFASICINLQTCHPVPIWKWSRTSILQDMQVIDQESSRVVFFFYMLRNTAKTGWCFDNILWFPEIGVPPNHPLVDGMFHEINQHFWIPPFMETPILYSLSMSLQTKMMIRRNRAVRRKIFLLRWRPEWLRSIAYPWLFVDIFHLSIVEICWG